MTTNTARLTGNYTLPVTEADGTMLACCEITQHGVSKSASLSAGFCHHREAINTYRFNNVTIHP